LQVWAAGVSVPWHWPRKQPSADVQAFPSLHGASLKSCRQPKKKSQVSSVQGLLSLQFGAVAFWHWPVAGLQVSTPLQALPSLAGHRDARLAVAGDAASMPLQEFESLHSASMVQRLRDSSRCRARRTTPGKRHVRMTSRRPGMAGHVEERHRADEPGAGDVLSMQLRAVERRARSPKRRSRRRAGCRRR
jgi:hypothetical protein